MRPFPLMLLCEGRQCLVIGEGDLADAKARLAHGANLCVTRLANLENYSSELFRSGSISFITNDNTETCISWARRLREDGFLVNVADQPDISDFILPAMIDRDPVLVAISTGGASATVARQLRGKIEAMLPNELGNMVRFIQSIRPQVSEIIFNTDEKRLFWDHVTGEGGLCDPFSGSLPPSEADLINLARNFLTQKRQQRVCLVKLLSNDPADMSLRGLRRLHQADLVVCIGDSEKMAGFADLARRDAKIQYEEKLIEPFEEMLNYKSIVILLSADGRIGSILPKDAQLEILTTGQVQL
jgi:uroporphyrin-III C-methyltransferase / precorrin-2 dehydrogenase / sirohydrochlorin ferrochelatase